MCCAAFIAKYALFIANLAFALLGLAVIGLGIGVLVALKDLQEILPVNIIPISLIVLGVLVFFIGFLACCGAIRESRCMLITYALIVSILVALFIWLTVVVFGHFDNIEEEVDRWIVSAFNNTNLRPAFNVMEVAFRCCGTIGAQSYLAANLPLPPTCCANPSAESICLEAQAFRGCGDMVGSWFSTITGAVGVVLLVIIIVQVVAVILALFLSHSIANDNRKRRQVY